MDVEVNFDLVDPMFFREEDLDGVQLNGPLADKIADSSDDDEDISPVKKRSRRRLARLFKKTKK